MIASTKDLQDHRIRTYYFWNTVKTWDEYGELQDLLLDQLNLITMLEMDPPSFLTKD